MNVNNEGACKPNSHQQRSTIGKDISKYNTRKYPSTKNKQTALPLVGAGVATKQPKIVHSKITHQSEVVSCLQQLKRSEQTAETEVAHNRTHGFNYSHPEALEWQMKSTSKQTAAAAAAAAAATTVVVPVGTVPKKTATSGLSVLLEAVDQVTNLQVPQQHGSEGVKEHHDLSSSTISAMLGAVADSQSHPFTKANAASNMPERQVKKILALAKDI